MDTERLLQIVLVLVVVWIALEVVQEFVSLLVGPFSSILGLLVIVLIVLFLLDVL